MTGRWHTWVSPRPQATSPSILPLQHRPSAHSAPYCRHYPRRTFLRVAGRRHRRQPQSLNPVMAILRIPPKHQPLDVEIRERTRIQRLLIRATGRGGWRDKLRKVQWKGWCYSNRSRRVLERDAKGTVEGRFGLELVVIGRHARGCSHWVHSISIRKAANSRSRTYCDQRCKAPLWRWLS